MKKACCRANADISTSARCCISSGEITFLEFEREGKKKVMKKDLEKSPFISLIKNNKFLLQCYNLIYERKRN